VWIEVNLQRALALARAGRCKDGLAVAKSLGSPVRDLVFTQDGLPSFLNSARNNFLLGEVFLACGQKKEADESYRLSAQATGASDIVWAWAAARKLDDYDAAQWRALLSAALSQAEANVETGSSPGWWLYSAGVLQIALGNTSKGQASLQEALLVPETRMSYHLSRLAIEGATPRATPR
jgi:hypothetical protein